MNWAKRNRRIVAFVSLAVLAGEISAAAADVLVLRSSGPSQRRHTPGQRLPDNATFNLRPGDLVVVLAGGGTRTFRGPGTFSANGPAQGSIASAGARRNTGAVRGPGDLSVPPPQPSDIWHLDVTRSGRACVAAGNRPTLWRPPTASAVQLTIAPPTGAPQTVQWPGGQQILAWPASIPISDGASYQLSWTGERTPRRLTLRSISPVPANDAALATALLASDCTNQLNVFIAQREVRTAGPSGATAR